MLMEPILTDGSVCSVCLEVLTLPRQLRCMHSICQKCLQDYRSKTVGSKGEVVNEYVCSVCSLITKSPKTGKPVGDWASFYSRRAISGTTWSKVKVERSCDSCHYAGQSNTAQWFCVVCEEGLCNACLTAHNNTKVTRDHKVINIEELTRTPENQIRFAEGFGCPDHRDRPMEYYCQIHEAVCCAHCFYSDHRTCAQEQDLNKYLSSLSDLRPLEIMEHMKKLDKHLKTFTLTNESNINKLEATLNNLAAEIRAVRKKVNEMLDEIEIMVKTEGNRIYKEEMIRRQEENHQCQILINAVRNSHTFLESVLKYGTDTQKFLVSKKSIAQLKSYTDQIREKYEEIKLLTVHLELGGLVKDILSPDLINIAKLQSKEDRKSFPCSGINENPQYSGTDKPLRERQIKLANVVDTHCPGKVSPYYLGGVQLPDGDIVLADYSNRTCCMFDSSYNFITSYKLPSEPRNMCLLDDHEVAVTLCHTKTYLFLSVKDKSIRDTGAVKTRYECYGMAAISREEVVVTGPTDNWEKCYWSLVNRTAGERSHHEFHCPGVSQAYIAVNNSKSRVYISVARSNSVYCFGLTDGSQYFVYTSNDLHDPLGVAVDREDCVYIVGYSSHNIHKLSPEGTTLQVITTGVPHHPVRIFFNKNRKRFFVTNDKERKKLHLFS